MLHRGYALVDGQRQPVAFIHNEAFVTQVRVEGSDVTYMLAAKFHESPDSEKVPA